MYVLQLLAKTVPKGPNSEIIAYDKWHCGATDFEKPLSHQLAKEDCPKRMFEADLCCRVHDMCYMEEQKSREQCDEAFCYCLERTVAQNANQTTNGCAGVSTSFCEIVKIFGGIAYLSSQELRTKQQKAMAKFEEEEKQRKSVEMSSSTTPKPTTESTKPSSTDRASSITQKEQATSSSTIQTAQASSSSTTSKPTNGTTPNASPTTSFPAAVHSTVSPAEIGQFVTHKFPLECFDNTLSFCTRQLHRCVSEQHSRRKSASSDGGSEDAFLLSVHLAECSSQFCACSSAESARARLASVPRPLLGGEQCAQSLAQICAQFEDEQGSKQYTGPTNVNYWSVSVNYSAFSANLGLVVTSVLLISLFLLLLVRLCPQIAISTIRKRIYRLSSCRHYDANGSTNYFPIGKECTASSPIGDAQRQQLQQHFMFPINRPAGRKNWHFNRLSNQTNDRTGISTPPLVLNSSQIRLHSSGNSSNTLSSEMSSSSSSSSTTS
ncbi:hypothetical protein niasHT_000705 [Heterodera trifolii]|uniref:Uncharacterized protein n=1 Tax=Heterodera trifolii TaxID=157864 RepID=A0ABD2MBY4_9BILA